MFRLTNVTLDTMVEYSNSKGEVIEFSIENLINRRLRDNIDPDKVYKILNGFLSFKGDSFRDELFNKFVEARNVILIQARREELDPVPYKIIHDISDMFDFEELVAFVNKFPELNIPNTLPDTFDEDILINELGTREQTYLKSDYVELVALIAILKATSGPLGSYASFKSSILSSNSYKEYILFNFYKTSKLFKVRPFVKLYASMNKLVDRLKKDSEASAIRVISGTMTLDTMPQLITALVVIQRLLLNNELEDGVLRNTVTKINSFAGDQLALKDKNGSAGNVKIKYFADEDTSSNEAESVFESSRTNSSTTQGFHEEFTNVSRDPYKLARQLGVKASKRQIDIILKEFVKFKDVNDYMPLSESIYIMSWLYTGILHPFAFKQLEPDAIIKHLAIGFLYLVENDFIDIALIISSTAVTSNEHRVNFALRNKLDNNVKAELDTLWTHSKEATVNGKAKEVNYAEHVVTKTAKKLVGYDLFSILNTEILLNDYGVSDLNISVPEDIKNTLTRLIIMIDKKA